MKKSEYSLNSIFEEVERRTGCCYADNYHECFVKIKKIFKGFYLCANNNPDLTKEQIKNITTINPDIYLRSLILVALTEESGKGSFISKIINGDIDKITNEEKRKFIGKVCYELYDSNAPDDRSEEEWHIEVERFLKTQIDNISISCKEYELKKFVNESLNKLFFDFYCSNNKESLIMPADFVKDIFIENSIEKYLNLNRTKNAPWIELNDIDEREYLIDVFKSRFNAMYEQYVLDVSQALYQKQKDSNLIISELLK